LTERIGVQAKQRILPLGGILIRITTIGWRLDGEKNPWKD
jgi:hypothetical protein